MSTTMTAQEAMDTVEIEIDAKRAHAEKARKERPGFAAQLDQEASAMEIVLNLSRRSST